MNVHLLKVTNAGHAREKRPCFYFYAHWLPSMGFIPGALVQVLPLDGEMVFNLCDENIERYSALDAMTREMGGKLLQVFNNTEKYKQIPTLLASGEFVHDAGFEIGDNLLASYEHGHIRVRKIPLRERVLTLSSIKDARTGEPCPAIRLTGWITDFGFLSDSLATVKTEPGLITFTLWDDGASKYREMVRQARIDKMIIVKVKEKKHLGKYHPYIRITGSSVSNAGFNAAEPLLASCDSGSIKLQQPSLDGLGF